MFRKCTNTKVLILFFHINKQGFIKNFTRFHNQCRIQFSKILKVFLPNKCFTTIANYIGKYWLYFLILIKKVSLRSTKCFIIHVSDNLLGKVNYFFKNSSFVIRLISFYCFYLQNTWSAQGRVLSTDDVQSFQSPACLFRITTNAANIWSTANRKT